MACESRASKFAARAATLGAGITSLASKRAFYAGVALGAAGTAALTATLNRFRRKPLWRSHPGPGAEQEIPAAGSRAHPKSLAGIEKATAPGSRTNPQPLAGIGKSAAAGSRANPRPLPGLARPPVTARPLPATRLQPAPVRISTGRGQTMILPDSYRVVKPDGAETGLALTRAVLPDSQGGHQPGAGWMITHTDSGLAMGGPYDSIRTAQATAGQLAVVVGDSRLSQAEKMDEARKIIGLSKGV